MHYNKSFPVDGLKFLFPHFLFVRGFFSCFVLFPIFEKYSASLCPIERFSAQGFFMPKEFSSFSKQ